MKKELIEKLKKYYPRKGSKSIKLNIVNFSKDTRFTKSEVSEIIEDLFDEDPFIYIDLTIDPTQELKDYLTEKGIDVTKFKYISVEKDPEYGLLANIMIESNKDLMKKLIDVIEDFKTSDGEQIECMNIKQLELIEVK